MNSFSTKIREILNRRFVKYGLPFFLVVIGGSFGLEQFAKIRYQFSRKQSFDISELKKHGIEVKKPGEVTLEGEYEKIKNMDIDNWVQVRGPRPWEENTNN